MVELVGPTASSPSPWAIFEVRRGRTEPALAFAATDTSYLRLSVRGRTVVERQRTLRPTDPNCCPGGPVRTRYVRWTGTRFAYGSRKPQSEPPPPQGPPDGYGVPAPSGEPGCEARVAVGRLELRAACLRRQPDGTYVTSGQVRFNGIDLVPAKGDAEIVLDPRSLELRASGTVRVQLGPVVLYEGSFNRRLAAQLTLEVPGGSSLKGFPVAGEAVVKLNSGGAEVDANVTVEALGGVSGAAKLNASMDAGLRLDALSLAVARAQVGAIPISDVSLVKVQLAGGELAYSTAGQITIKGNLDLALAGVGFQGDLSGFVDGLRAFDAEGTGSVGFKGKGLSGEGLVSSAGAAACAESPSVFGLKVGVGFGVRWESFPKPSIMAGSCGLGDWRVGPAARASQARAFRVTRRTPLLAVSAVGVGAAPNVTLRGPGGVVVPTPPEGVWTTVEGDRFAFRNPDDVSSYFAIRRPRPGRWTLTPEPGSAPVAQTRRANPLPWVRIAARVRGRGSLRRLSWRVSRRPGLRVVFLQRGPNGTRRVAASRGGRGSRRFVPLPGRARARRIVALVEQRGIPQGQRAVARFPARTARPGRPARVRVVRRGTRVVVRWSRARAAVRHRVRVNVSDGRRLLFEPRHDRRVRVAGVARRHRVSVSVRGVDTLGRTGPGPARATAALTLRALSRRAGSDGWSGTGRSGRSRA